VTVTVFVVVVTSLIFCRAFGFVMTTAGGVPSPLAGGGGGPAVGGGAAGCATYSSAPRSVGAAERS